MLLKTYIEFSIETVSIVTRYRYSSAILYAQFPLQLWKKVEFFQSYRKFLTILGQGIQVKILVIPT